MVKREAAGDVYLAGIQSRGFLLASLMAQEFELGLLTIKKQGKTPPPSLCKTYDLEYGSETLEISSQDFKSRKVILVDDVLVTGGTLLAAKSLCEEAGATVLGSLVLLNLEGSYRDWETDRKSVV